MAPREWASPVAPTPTQTIQPTPAAQAPGEAQAINTRLDRLEQLIQQQVQGFNTLSNTVGQLLLN